MQILFVSSLMFNAKRRSGFKTNLNVFRGARDI